jgi:hypothetical protein
MANTFKLRTKANVGVTTTVVYTTPAATTTTVIGITLANVSGNSINVGVGVSRTGQDSVRLLKDAPVPQGSTLEFMSGNKIVLEATDMITVVSDTNASLDASIALLEIN